ncbi:MAG: PQQ-dependent sugar dehydrogenase [Alphaproteobacteria bacterium]
MKFLSRALIALALSGFAVGAQAESKHDAILKRIKLPPGFTISVFAEVPKPRSLVIGRPLGTVFVGSRHGTIYALRDTNRDGKANEIHKLAGGLKTPNGVAFQDGLLYIAETARVFRWAVPAEFDLTLPLQPRIPVFTGLPTEFLHGWRYAAFGPDRKLYVSVGSPCNICKPKGYEGTIIRMDANGKNVEVYARGIRNSVGFDWHPKTKEMFFTDNGADDMGDDVPPDELNRVTAKGQNFGFPVFGGKVRLTGMEKAKPPAGATPPVIEFQAHSANLGIHFYTGKMFPSEYVNDAFVAQHGSWNRPVDIKTLPDDSLVISDDYASVIYRISYQGKR